MRTCSTQVETRHAYKVLAGKPERKRQVGRTKNIWNDNIKMNLKERLCEGMDWIQVPQNESQ